MSNDAVTHSLCTALQLRPPIFTQGSAPIRCHRCQALLDPLYPTAHLISCCGHSDLTRRHDHIQREAVVPIASQFAGRPAVCQNVLGCPGPGYEMDVVVDGIPNSPPISIDIVVSEPTAASHVRAAAAASGASSAASIRHKETHYRVNSVPPPFPPGVATFLPWAVEGPGHIDDTVRTFLRRAADERAAFDSPYAGAAPTDAELARSKAAAGALYASWIRLLTLVTVRASSEWLARTLRRCIVRTRNDDAAALLPPRESARRAAAPALFADLPSSAAARCYYAASLPRHAGNF